MGNVYKKIQGSVSDNFDPDNIKKRITMLVDMQIESLQFKMAILQKCKADAANTTKIDKLVKIYRDLVEMVQSDNNKIK